MKAPVRIRPIQQAAVAAAGGDEYLARLVKLIPSEVIALYLTGVQLAKSWPGIWAFVCFILVLVARVWGTKDGAGLKAVQWVAVAVSAVSFIIWVYATGGRFFGWTLPPEAGSIGVLIWTFAVPYFYKGT